MMIYVRILFYTESKTLQYVSDRSNRRRVEVGARKYFCDEVSYPNGV